MIIGYAIGVAFTFLFLAWLFSRTPETVDQLDAAISVALALIWPFTWLAMLWVALVELFKRGRS